VCNVFLDEVVVGRHLFPSRSIPGEWSWTRTHILQ
jgi:hypothetical protein